MSKTPPGPSGRPVFGSSRRYAQDPFAFLTALEGSYGRIAQFDMGPLNTYMIADPATIERVLVSEADTFRKPAFQDDPLGALELLPTPTAHPAVGLEMRVERRET
nr:cytochrome P450 [Haloarchaeobius salinus]